MHDPMTVAFEIPLPIPRRSLSVQIGPRWSLTIRRRTNPENLGQRLYPWWRPRGYRVVLAGHEQHLRRAVTVWHVEPGGHDSGEVCSHRRQRADGTWTYTSAWRWHVHHWRLQVPALQALRRTLLTRCAWCGGRSTRHHRVNISHSWDGPRAPWWRGEPGLFHLGCSSAEHAARSCTCPAPVLEHDGYGRCARCALFYGYGRTDDETARLQLLKQCPPRTAPTEDLIAKVHAMAAAAKEAGRA